MTVRVHPFPSRTRKLSSLVPKILGWRRPGKIGRRQHLYSSLAQSVEHLTVNQGVVGSSPTGGAKKEITFVYQKLLLFLSKPQAWHIINYSIAIVVSHQSVRTVYHHALACIKNTFAMMIYINFVLMICNSLRN